jgi:dipeptidyl-peptidase-4
MPRRSVGAVSLLLLMVAGAPAGAQTAGGTLTIEDVYGPVARVDYFGAPPPQTTWTGDDEYLRVRTTSTGRQWMRTEATTGRETPLFDPADLASALGRVPAIDADAAATASQSSALALSPSRMAALVSVKGDLYAYRLDTRAARRLTTADGDETLAQFSPDGRRVAFVRANNLFTVGVDGGPEVVLTRDGAPDRLNGALDWLYQEEVFGRGEFHAFWWSPDSKRLAFLQLDERQVPAYAIVDHLPTQPAIESGPYPRAGDPNPVVRLGLVDADGGDVRWVDLDTYPAADRLIVNVSWQPDSRAVFVQVQNREQTWLDLVRVEATGRSTSRVLRETTRAWVEPYGNPTWLEDGTFLWISARSGTKQLYRVRQDGTVAGTVPTGAGEFRTLYGVDARRGLVYFAAGAARHVDTGVFRVRVDGTGLAALTRTPGTHAARFNPSFTRFIDVWSDLTTPPQVSLHDAESGDRVRTIEANPVPALQSLRAARAEFVEIRARDGMPLDGLLFRPQDFDPTRRYPVYQVTYAGPGTPIVRNQWMSTDFLFYQLIAQRGVMVWLLDPRSAGGRSVEAQWTVYGNLGAPELRDLEDGLDWLTTTASADPARLVIGGASYGGFMAAYALTHSSRWRAGFVNAPVTDWRNYDSIYTERYMQLPAHNPDGYRRSAPRASAAQLSGPILLMHGELDDNVHMQNSIQFAYDLQVANKPFQLMIYPRTRHGVSDRSLLRHATQTLLDFLLTYTAPASGR